MFRCSPRAATGARRVDRVLVIDCSEPTQIERVEPALGLDARGGARAVVAAASATRAARRAIADAVIFNDGLSLAELEAAVNTLYGHWRDRRLGCGTIRRDIQSTSRRLGPLRIPVQREHPHDAAARTPVRPPRPADRPRRARGPPLRARDDVRDHGRRLASRPEVRSAEGARAPQGPVPVAIAAIRPSPRLRWTRSWPASTTRSTALNQLAGQGRPGADQQRMADEHPQPHQHPGRHVRVRPARLLRVAAARAGTPARRPAAVDRHPDAAGRGAVRPAGPACATPARRTRWWRPAASTSKACRRTRSTCCCALAWTARNSSPRSAVIG